MSWYAITVAPTAERKVRDALNDHGLEAYFPVEKVWRTALQKGRRISHERPLLRGYVFAKTADLAHLVALAHDIEGVVHVFAFQYGAAKVAEFIDQLRQHETAGDFDETLPRDKQGKIRRKLEPGDPVRVIGGPFFGFVGKLQSLPGRRRAQVVLTLFGREGPVTLDLLQLEAA